jgi:hypothetical protein
MFGIITYLVLRYYTKSLRVVAASRLASRLTSIIRDGQGWFHWNAVRIDGYRHITNKYSIYLSQAACSSAAKSTYGMLRRISCRAECRRKTIAGLTDSINHLERAVNRWVHDYRREEKWDGMIPSKS